MVSFDHLPIVRKFALILAIFGFLAVQSVIYSTGAMLAIDASYRDAINREGALAVVIPKANRSLTQIMASIGELAMSTTEADNVEALRQIAHQRDRLAINLDDARKAVPERASAIDAIEARAKALIDQSCAKAIRLAADSIKTDSNLVAQAEYLKSCAPSFASLLDQSRLLGEAAFDAEHKLGDTLAATTRSTVITTYVALLGSLALILLCSYVAITAWVSRPIKILVGSMTRLARGDLDVDVAGSHRRDEIGFMARAVQIFKDNAVKLRASEAESARIQVEREAVVAALAGGLDRLAKGDLTGRLDQSFSAAYEKLRTDFNVTADSLHQALRTITQATGGITAGSNEIAQASDNLARRTEQQAANLEETASALSAITDQVRKMATGADEAARVVVTTRGTVLASGAVVQEAIDAMSKIKDSSQQISQIIGVIDEIAAQTNLLSLNAAIEAAGAGDAGRGFAVVAQEVRGLAQRSAEAAKEIKSLISASTAQVEGGVELVAKTGEALRDIVAKVTTIDALVREISVSSGEQATSLGEINSVMGQMDQVVQQNAAMVEESTAAAHALRLETQDLTAMVGRFRIGMDARDTAPSPRVGGPFERARAAPAEPWRGTASGKTWREF
jgi:methyl-accepting chemotaxis protein